MLLIRNLAMAAALVLGLAARAVAEDAPMQIAGANPQWVRREEVPAAVVAKEIEIAKAQMRDQKKPEAILEKIAQGKIEKFYSEFCLMEQASVRDPNVSIAQLVQDAIRILGENITISRFVRMKVGEQNA